MNQWKLWAVVNIGRAAAAGILAYAVYQLVNAVFTSLLQALNG